MKAEADKCNTIIQRLLFEPLPYNLRLFSIEPKIFKKTLLGKLSLLLTLSLRPFFTVVLNIHKLYVLELFMYIVNLNFENFAIASHNLENKKKIGNPTYSYFKTVELKFAKKVVKI